MSDIIIGAGITGLSYGYFTKRPFILFEASDFAGGLCRSVKEDGFTFDCSGHFVHIKNPEIKKNY